MVSDEMRVIFNRLEMSLESFEPERVSSEMPAKICQNIATIKFMLLISC